MFQGTLAELLLLQFLGQRSKLPRMICDLQIQEPLHLNAIFHNKMAYQIDEIQEVCPKMTRTFKVVNYHALFLSRTFRHWENVKIRILPKPLAASSNDWYESIVTLTSWACNFTNVMSKTGSSSSCISSICTNIEVARYTTEYMVNNLVGGFNSQPSWKI